MPTSTPQQDKHFLSEAIKLAEQGQYTCDPNPRVGCVLVGHAAEKTANNIIAQGYHQKAGEGHAEVNAIEHAKQQGISTKGATAYVSLEPCSFTGKTPPCVTALIHAGVARVVCATLDPNPKVAGNGLKLLQQAGIDASVIEDAEIQVAAEWLNRGFFQRMRYNKPWVMLKTASSLDGRTADSQGKSQWITSEAARSDVHKLRAASSAMITGSGTQQADNPSLNARLVDTDKTCQQPIRILLDSNCLVSVDDNIVGDDQALTIFTSFSSCTPQKKQGQLQAFAGKATVEVVDEIQLDSVLAYLSDKHINSVMIEAGAKLSGAFLEADLVDEIVHYIAPSVIGSDGRGMFDFSTPLALKDKKQFKIHSIEQIGDDIKVVYVRSCYF